jgi:NADP-dependent 3-hydroxy acid dehydrogenase YdfG
MNKIAVIFMDNGAIANEIAEAFSCEGVEAFITGRNERALNFLANEILSSGSKAHVQTVSATKEDQIDHFLEIKLLIRLVRISFQWYGDMAPNIWL